MKKQIRIYFAIILTVLMTISFPLGITAGNIKELIVAGIPFGVRFHTEGVIVIGIPGGKGPAAEAGIRRGDIITAIDGNPVVSAEEFAEKIRNAGETELTLDFKSGELSHTAHITPKADESGEYKIGVWVKDSAAGIGTVTFIEPKTMSFAGLGHGICDAESGEP